MLWKKAHIAGKMEEAEEKGQEEVVDLYYEWDGVPSRRFSDGNLNGGFTDLER